MDNPDEIRIDLNPKVKSIIKFGLAFQGLIILLGLPVLIFLGLKIVDDIQLLSLLPFGGAIFFFFIAKKYFENIYYNEYIFLNPNTLTIVIKKLGNIKEYKFDIKDIQYLCFAGDLQYTKHPMDNDVVDFTGLATTERELQFIINEGTLEIETEDETLRFGKNIPSWEAEDIISTAETYLGIKFKSKYFFDESGGSTDI